MSTSITIILISFITDIILKIGYIGIFILMTLESAGLPIPSEIIMPFSGFLVFNEKFSFWPVILAGTIGNLAGSIILYFIGKHIGRPIIIQYGKYFLIRKKELIWAENWFQKYGNITVFFSRLLPVIRTYISLPAGLTRMPVLKFSFYTAIGSLLWTIILTYVGIILGSQWNILENYFRQLDWIIVIIIIILLGWYIYKKLKTRQILININE